MEEKSRKTKNRIESFRFRCLCCWGRLKGHYDISIDDLLNGISREKKSEQAEKLIMDCLSDGKYQQQLILKKAQNIGISKRVLDKAKKSLGVKSIKEGNGWYWELPEEKEASNC